MKKNGSLGLLNIVVNYNVHKVEYFRIRALRSSFKFVVTEYLKTIQSAPEFSSVDSSQAG